MKRDITAILKEWPYKAGQVNARFVVGSDGLERVQVRLDLGVLQMYADGRPDGDRPFGYPSLLEYFEAKFDEQNPRTPDAPPPPGHDADDGDDAGEAGDAPDASHELDHSLGELRDERRDNDPEHESQEREDEQNHPRNARGEDEEGDAVSTVALDGDACRALREEAAQYYQRYVACLSLDDYERVIRDTTRNLRVLDLCAQRAETDHDRNVLEQFRPYITMVRARALASQAIKENELRAAVLALDQALESLKRYYTAVGRPQSFSIADEVRMLQAMREALVPKLPISQRSELRERLQRALETENYELAAILRDELKQLREET
jgi:hypothetical protein